MTVPCSITSRGNLFYYLVLLACISVDSLERCPTETGGGFCPSGNTCCPQQKGTPSSGCIPADLGAWNATCCDDLRTGCGVGYVCGPNGSCIAKPTHLDPLVQKLPRYQLCQAPNMQRIYGFGPGVHNHIKPAYYSTIGNLEACTAEACHFRQVIISIHGAGRNADDYFCSMYSASRYGIPNDASKDIVIVAPRFAAEADEAFALYNGGVPMRWNEGSWRYGQESTNLGSHVSSFQVLDDMIALFSNYTKFPSLKSIRVIGHSAGGQFVQRWALLTDSWNIQPSLRAIVVNPSSYAYLTPLRKLATQKWEVPDVTKCPDYNKWEWGLEISDREPLYVQHVLSELSNAQLLERFSTRDVVYLAGDRDVCNVPGMDENGWCYSHGLETSCMDMLEGKNRLERHMNYYESLGRLNVTTHRRDLIPGVGHDHSLIFHSEVTRKYLFGDASAYSDKQ